MHPPARGWRAIHLAVALAVACLGACSGEGDGGGGGPAGLGPPEEPGLAVGDPAWLSSVEPQSFDAAWGRVAEQAATDGYFAAAGRELTRLLDLFAEADATEYVDRPRTTLTRFFPIVSLGEPWRNELSWTGGVHERVYFLNRWGAKLTGDLWGPPDLFTRAARRPAVVVTDGSIQANARMYWWAAQELAEHGYVVLTYDVQGQGESETWGHRPDGSIWCGGVDQPPSTPPFLRELGDCPGFPFQQSANFGGGAIDAHDFLLSTPDAPWERFQEGTGTQPWNPWHAHVDPDRVGAAGHSFGAAAVSFVQGVPELLRRPVRAIVAWDSLSSCTSFYEPSGECPPEARIEPLAPALNLASDYFFPSHVTEMPDPAAGRAAFDHWRAAGTEVVSIVLGGGTHLEYTSGPFHPATRLGQDLAIWYTLAFFDRHLRDDPTARGRLLAREIEVRHRDPLGQPAPAPELLRVRDFASFLTYSAVAIGDACSLDWKYRTDPC